MDAFLRYQRTLFLVIAVLTAGGAAALYAALPESPSYALGFLAGGAAGLVVFRMRALQVVRLPQLPESEWSKAALRSNLISLGILGGVAVAALAIETLDVFAALGGMVLERIVLILDGFLRPGALSESRTGPEADPGATAGEQL